MHPVYTLSCLSSLNMCTATAATHGLAVCKNSIKFNKIQIKLQVFCLPFSVISYILRELGGINYISTLHKLLT